MSSFDDLNIDPGLLNHLRELGYTRATALQREAVPVIARGTTASGIASTGSGKTLAYALGLAARLDYGASELQALVLRPTDHAAAATAEALHRLLLPCEARVTVAPTVPSSAAQIVAASPSAVLAALEHSTIKLAALKALVVDGASSMFELGDEAALETLTAQVPKDAQRLVLTSRLTKQVEDWVDRHARRARRLVYVPSETETLTGVRVELFAAPRTQWLPALAAVLSTGAKAGARAGAGAKRAPPRTRISCRFAAEAGELSQQLVVRGFPTGSTDEPTGIRIESTPGSEPESASLSISWGTPSDVEEFRDRGGGAARLIVFADPRELPHLQLLAEALKVRIIILKSGVVGEASRSIQATRDMLRDAAAKQDLEPYVQLLEPLLEEFTATEIAAAATALLRERTPEVPRTPLPAWTRLYFGVGRRDSVRPADLVGAITGESPLSGDRIGRIEIRDTYTSVEVAADVADQVIRGLATATIRGRPANVRVFRE